ncbi:hypothetical protein CDEST_10013 [Colletotrichum destructivum]|uniref:Uncharacterized protein n=1 Tax=Colletotrichum destructivum TaxID=34406 RepID=A0AAX4IQ38_9PEZI|nr:hypothetical protein CDEST_10013 [Colletotrichum destructivum]
MTENSLQQLAVAPRRVETSGCQTLPDAETQLSKFCPQGPTHFTPPNPNRRKSTAREEAHYIKSLTTFPTFARSPKALLHPLPSTSSPSSTPRDAQQIRFRL